MKETEIIIFFFCFYIFFYIHHIIICFSFLLFVFQRHYEISTMLEMYHKTAAIEWGHLVSLADIVCIFRIHHWSYTYLNICLNLWRISVLVFSFLIIIIEPNSQILTWGVLIILFPLLYINFLIHFLSQRFGHCDFRLSSGICNILECQENR